LATQRGLSTKHTREVVPLSFNILASKEHWSNLHNLEGLFVMQTLRELESFSSVAEMDNFIREAFEVLELSELDRKILKLLAGHSCKFVGVSWLKVASIGLTPEFWTISLLI
jgi:hypothetical protein